MLGLRIVIAGIGGLLIGVIFANVPIWPQWVGWTLMAPVAFGWGYLVGRIGTSDESS